MLPLAEISQIFIITLFIRFIIIIKDKVIFSFNLNNTIVYVFKRFMLEVVSIPLFLLYKRFFYFIFNVYRKAVQRL